MKKIILACLLALVPLGAFAETAPAPSAYDRVTKSGVLRCGYLTWPHFHDVDVSTGKMSGLWHDLVMTMAEGMNLKVEWVEEISPADFIAALNSGRVDAMCAPCAVLLPRLRGAAFTTPIIYVEMRAYVRADDTRFDGGLASLDAPEVRITAMEGEFNAVMARTRYSKAQVIQTPSVLGPAQGYMDVADGKADVVFADSMTISDYVANNPGKLKPLAEPLGVFGVGLPVDGHEAALSHMLDSAARMLVETGVVAGLIRKYGMQDHVLITSYPSARVR